MAVGSIAGATISSSGASKSAKDANNQRLNAYKNAKSYLSRLGKRSPAFLAKAFGDELNPEAFLYHKVDLTQSQLDTIKGNIKAFPKAKELVDKVNPSIWENDINRIRTMMPQFDRARDSYVGTTRMLQEGKLPFSDVMDITSASSSSAAAGGTPGGSRNATLKDLGLSRLDAMERGNSMFANFMQIAQEISPVEHQMRPQQMMFTPQERAQMDIEQAALDQQGRASAELARAMPDPATNAIVNAQIGLEMASMGQSYNPTAGMGAMGLGQGITNASSAIGNYMMQSNRSQPQQSSLYSSATPATATGGTQYFGSQGTQSSPVYMSEMPTSSFNPNAGFSSDYSTSGFSSSASTVGLSGY